MIYQNIFSPKEIDMIATYFAKAPISNVDYGDNINKNLDYHLPHSLSHRIIRPKIQELLGDHKFASGSYKECSVPYGVHFDNIKIHNKSLTVFETESDLNKVVLIPLVEGDDYSTVTFNVFSEEVSPMNVVVDPKYLGPHNGIDASYFSHIPEPALSQMQYLPVDVHYHWQLGDALVWQRDQLHTGTNFKRNNDDRMKKFIVLFLA